MVRRRLQAAAVLTTFVASLVLSGFSSSHAWGDADLAGSEFGLLGGHARTQIEPVLPPVAGEHCALCHWLRNLGQSRHGRSEPLPQLVAVGPGIVATTLSLVAVFGDSSSARGPPSASLN
jgi:hypothetical protein